MDGLGSHIAVDGRLGQEGEVGRGLEAAGELEIVLVALRLAVNERLDVLRLARLLGAELVAGAVGAQVSVGGR